MYKRQLEDETLALKRGLSCRHVIDPERHVANPALVDVRLSSRPADNLERHALFISQKEPRRIAAALDLHGCAVVNGLVPPETCDALAKGYDDEDAFRSRIVMARHGFGRGEYKYFAYPLPPVVSELRAALYPALADIANPWNEAMGIGVRYPSTLAEFLDRCHRAGQTKPTPLV